MEEIKVGNQTLREDDLEIKVEYQGEMFIMAYPNQWTKAEIERLIALKLGGMPRNSYTPEHVANIEAFTYVNELVNTDKSPSWFKSAWTCYNEELIQKLFAGYLAFRNKFRTKIQDGGFAGRGKK